MRRLQVAHSTWRTILSASACPAPEGRLAGDRLAAQVIGVQFVECHAPAVAGRDQVGAGLNAGEADRVARVDGCPGSRGLPARWATEVASGVEAAGSLPRREPEP